MDCVKAFWRATMVWMLSTAFCVTSTSLVTWSLNAFIGLGVTSLTHTYASISSGHFTCTMYSW